LLTTHYNNNNNVFLSADTKSIVQTHTFCTTQVDKNIQNRAFCNGDGGRTTGLQTHSQHYCSL